MPNPRPQELDKRNLQLKNAPHPTVYPRNFKSQQVPRSTLTEVGWASVMSQFDPCLPVGTPVPTLVGLHARNVSLPGGAEFAWPESDGPNRRAGKWKTKSFACICAAPAFSVTRQRLHPEHMKIICGRYQGLDGSTSTFHIYRLERLIYNSTLFVENDSKKARKNINNNRQTDRQATMTVERAHSQQQWPTHQSLNTVRWLTYVENKSGLLFFWTVCNTSLHGSTK